MALKMTKRVWTVILPWLIYFICIETAKVIIIEEFPVAFCPTETIVVCSHEIFDSFGIQVYKEKSIKRLKQNLRTLHCDNFVLCTIRGHQIEKRRETISEIVSSNRLVFFVILELLFVNAVLLCAIAMLSEWQRRITLKDLISTPMVSASGCFSYYSNERAERSKKFKKYGSKKRWMILFTCLTCICLVTLTTVTSIIFWKNHLMTLFTVQLMICILVCYLTLYILQGSSTFDDAVPCTDTAMVFHETVIQNQPKEKLRSCKFMDNERYEHNSTAKAKESRCYHHSSRYHIYNQETEHYIYQSKDHEETYTKRSVECTDNESSFRATDLEAACTIPLCTSVENCTMHIGTTVDKIHRNPSYLTLPIAETYSNVEYEYSALVDDNHSLSPLKLCASITDIEHIQSVDSYIGLMLKYELIRLMTFKEVITPVSALRLAQSGFFYTSYTTKCFSCGVTYGEWKHCNNVHDVHCMKSPKCKMVLYTESINKSVNSRTTKEMFRELEISSVLKYNVTNERTIAKYKMNARPIGIAVIINNELFDGEFEDRTGTHRDAEKLNKLWTDLKFKVVYHHNLTAAQMIRTARDIAQLDHTDNDCLVFCVLTHGANGILYGKDEISVKIQEIIDYYLSSSCRSLAGKPKLFFIQACQGTNPQEGQQLSTDTTYIYPDNRQKEIIPNEADFLVSFSTVTGCVSFRCPQNGTWYINSLVENLRKCSKNCDLITIMTRVNLDVGEKSLQEGSNTYKQIPIYKSTLCKHVFLTSQKI